jgi:hypothetical protein
MAQQPFLPKMNSNEEWILRKALAEDGQQVSVGGLVGEMSNEHCGCNLHTGGLVMCHCIDRKGCKFSLLQSENADLQNRLLGAQALADEKCRHFLTRAEAAEKQVIKLRSQLIAAEGSIAIYKRDYILDEPCDCPDFDTKYPHRKSDHGK